MNEGLNRVRVRVPLPFIERVRTQGGESGQENLLSQVEGHVESVGFDHTLLVMEDPTDASMFSLLTRRTSEPITPDPLLRFVSVEPVQEPPAEPIRQVNHPEALDSGLTPEEILMVRQALAEETNPRHLKGTAYVFEPFFPVSASLLHTRSDLLDIRKTPESRTNRDLHQHVDAKLRELHHRSIAPHPSNVPPTIERAKQALQQLSVRSRMPLKVIHDEVRRAACIIVEDDPDELPKLRRFPREILDAAKLTIVTFANIRTRNWHRVLRIVDPNRLNLLVPPDSSKDGFVSPSAIQLALATSKPVASGVMAPIKSPVLYDQLLKAGGTERGMKARAQMERANRALERRRWVDWWRRRNAIRAQG